MDRLTVHGATSQRDIDRLMEYSNENQFGRNQAYYKLQEYEDLDTSGKLIKLPCAIGDIVWEVDFDLKYMDEFKITDITITEDGIWFENPYMGFGFNSGDLGSTVFLTHAEAEAALERSRLR